ncbi:MAG TPA: tRNA (pseudouridine(54)-N(1))-methyltransferase TrmY [Acidobacteriota bacterium]|nr:tRNA (pseudouridine(54)-N(1))-methyltransferase TrmY [Acidobacteriota bacterium]
MKREFILRARKSRTDHNWSLDDLPAAGRMEVVAACASNAICISNHLRNDTIIHLVLEGPPTPPKLISIDGAMVQGFEFGEAGVAKFIHKALKLSRNGLENPMPGVTVQKKSFEALVREKCESGASVFYLHPDGEDIRTTTLSDHVVFLFGDYIGMPSKSESLLDRLGCKQITLGPVVLFASHCITVVHNELDRRN